MENQTRRRQAREFALQVLFQRKFNEDFNPEDTLAYFKGAFEAEEHIFQYHESWQPL